MSSLEKAQHSLAQLIYSISDLRILDELQAKLKSHVAKEADDARVTSVSPTPPWQNAIVDIQPLPTFDEVVKAQNKQPLCFEELEPLIDDVIESDGYTLEDLLNAVN